MLTAERVLDEYYLEARCKLLELAAILDRYERGGGDFTGSDDPRIARCRQTIALLAEARDHPNRAEAAALIFSDPPEVEQP